MRFRYKTRIISSVAGLLLAASSLITTQGWAGPHFTDEEIAIWRIRKDSGPYKDEWSAILSNAMAWRNKPDARWPGRTQASCYVDNGAGDPSRRRDSGMTDAAFVYVMTGDTSYRDAVRTQLLAQAAVVGTNFADRTRWCPVDGLSNRYGADIGPWIRRLTYAYSYIRSSLSTGDRQTLDSWFLAAANYFDTVIHNIIAKRFPNRFLDDYTTCVQSGFCPGSTLGRTHFGGYNVHGFNWAWDNLTASMNAVVVAVGATVNDAKLLAHGKRFIQEWLKFSVFPDGTIFDQYRWNKSDAQSGYKYAGVAIGSIIASVEHIARTGDTSLYTYSTTDGRYGSEGGPKTLLKVLTNFAGMTNGTITRYASSSATTNPGLRIYYTGPGGTFLDFVNLAPANIFYNNSAIATAYQTSIPASYTTPGYESLRGEWGSYPRIRFMFGQMEGKVWPYGAQRPKALPTPRNLRTIVERP